MEANRAESGLNLLAGQLSLDEAGPHRFEAFTNPKFFLLLLLFSSPPLPLIKHTDASQADGALAWASGGTQLVPSPVIRQVTWASTTLSKTGTELLPHQAYQSVRALSGF